MLVFLTLLVKNKNLSIYNYIKIFKITKNYWLLRLLKINLLIKTFQRVV